MNTKILGFTATDNSHQNDIYIVNFDESKVTKDTTSPINFKFGLFNYKEGDKFIADFIFTVNGEKTINHRLDLNDIIIDDDGVLKKDGDHYSSQFSFNVFLPIEEGIVKCKMSLKQKDKEIDNATTYFALKKL